MAGGNQQFCLRWNNHQSTLVSVFDTLFESGTLVDCTLAAEGRFLKAHKVVLSACSPYLEALLSQHYEKHPIIILKDVTFTELKAMLDYMYRGEVNISQDQLGTFLKAAESLHIKGLTDNSGGGSGVNEHPQQHKKAVEFPRKIYNPVVAARPKSPAFPQGLIVEPRPFKMAATGVMLNNNNNNNNIEPNNSTPSQDGGMGGASPKRTKRRRSCSDDKPLDCALETSNEAPTPASLVHCSIEGGGGGGSTPTQASDSSLGGAMGAGPPPVKLEPKLEEYNNDDSGDDRQPYDDDEEDDLEAKPGTSANSHPSGKLFLSLFY
ncbi:hypothetical protein AAG570_013982 [Ranatra chinensis]|uniref:BTB domain-containing protein n=1 Tax=Ranatra chinensis TaxID=642074 RepID=A0ABD0YE10_9HEMI